MQPLDPTPLPELFAWHYIHDENHVSLGLSKGKTLEHMVQQRYQHQPKYRNNGVSNNINEKQ